MSNVVSILDAPKKSARDLDRLQKMLGDAEAEYEYHRKLAIQHSRTALQIRQQIRKIKDAETISQIG